jgi:antitoxin component YwqK of YwqJK toxin-antitoxin module
MKTYWISFLFTMLLFQSMAQSDSLQKKEFVRNYGKFKEKTIFHDKNKRFVTVQMSNEAGDLLYEIYYKDGLREGTAKGFYDDGTPYWTANYKDDILHGPFMVWYKDGSIRRKEFYKRAYRKEKKCFDQNGDEVPFFEFQTQPQYPGGEYALQTYLRKKMAQN